MNMSLYYELASPPEWIIGLCWVFQDRLGVNHDPDQDIQTTDISIVLSVVIEDPELILILCMRLRQECRENLIKKYF